MADPTQQPSSEKQMASVSFVQKHLARKALVTTSKFSSGANAGLKWLEWAKEGDNAQRLRAAYDTQGVQGVQDLLVIGKSQTYELIAKLGWRREKIRKKRKARAMNYNRDLYFKRLAHLFEHHGWAKGMNCCFLDSFVTTYPRDFQVGNKKVLAQNPICVAKLPAPAVRAFMKRFGLKFYVTKVAVVPIDKVADKAQSLIFKCNLRHLVRPRRGEEVKKSPIVGQEPLPPSETMEFWD